MDKASSPLLPQKQIHCYGFSLTASFLPPSPFSKKMGSKLIPQPLVGILRNPTYPLLPPPPPPAKLGFRRGTSFSASHVCVRRVFQCSFWSNVNPVLSVSSRSGLVARAEDNAEAGVGELAADTEAEEEKEEVEAEVKEPRKPRVKLGEIIGILNKRAIEASDNQRPIPDIRTGDVVELKVKKKTRRRLATYKGIVISKQNAGIHSTIRVRRIIAGIGVEIVFPLYSPNIKEIKVVRHRKVRRAKLYYLRDKLPRFSTFK